MSPGVTCLPNLMSVSSVVWYLIFFTDIFYFKKTWIIFSNSDYFQKLIVLSQISPGTWNPLWVLQYEEHPSDHSQRQCWLYPNCTLQLILDHFDKPSPPGLCYKTKYIWKNLNMNYQLCLDKKKKKDTYSTKQNEKTSQLLLTFFVLSIAFSMVMFKSSKTDRTFSYSPKCWEKYSEKKKPKSLTHDLKNWYFLKYQFNQFWNQL